MNTATPASEPARILDGYVRMLFLPALFGDDFFRAEHNVYLYADRYLADYDGAVWDFALLPSGGGFMKPADEERWRFVNSGNDNDVAVSNEAAGIIITALVLNHRSWMYDRHDEEELCRHYCQRHRQLAALQATKSVLSGVQAGQAVALDAANSGNTDTAGSVPLRLRSVQLYSGTWSWTACRPGAGAIRSVCANRV